MSRTLSSKLKNRLEIWGNVKIETDIGKTTEAQLIRKVWGKITPVYGYQGGAEANTIKSTSAFKIEMRRTDIKTDNWIEYKGNRYDISHILPHYNGNKYIEVHTLLVVE